MNDTGPHLGKSKQNQEIPEFKILVGTNVSHVQTVNYYWYVHFKTITMKTFGVVRAENKKSTRKKMPKIRLILSIICHRYFDTNHFIIWFVYFLVCFGNNQLIPLGVGRGGLAVFVNKINNLATQSWKQILTFAP